MGIHAQHYIPTGFYIDPMQPNFIELKLARAQAG